MPSTDPTDTAPNGNQDRVTGSAASNPYVPPGDNGPGCTCKWSPVVGRLLCPVCVERHLARNEPRKADY